MAMEHNNTLPTQDVVSQSFCIQSFASEHSMVDAQRETYICSEASTFASDWGAPFAFDNEFDGAFDLGEIGELDVNFNSFSGSDNSFTGGGLRGWRQSAFFGTEDEQLFASVGHSEADDNEFDFIGSADEEVFLTGVRPESDDEEENEIASQEDRDMPEGINTARAFLSDEREAQPKPQEDKKENEAAPVQPLGRIAELANAIAELKERRLRFRQPYVRSEARRRF